MPTPVVATLVLVAGLIVAWLYSEFGASRGIRILLGASVLCTCPLLAFVVGSLQQLNDNAWYGDASAKLIETITTEVEENRADQLLPALRQLRSDFSPTYQNRANYDEVVTRFATEVASAQRGKN